MEITDIHPIKISFNIPVAPDRTVSRFVYSYLINSGRLYLIDTGVKGAEKDISAALKKIGKTLEDIDTIILTHSHPDHIGAASLIKVASNAEVCAHRAERPWIENVELQGKERPVPGFSGLVSDSLKVDRLLEDDDILNTGSDDLAVLHTPGHSSGSISLLSKRNGILFSGDLIPQPGSMPIYEDVITLTTSLSRIRQIGDLTALYSSWAKPQYGNTADTAIQDGIHYIKTVHNAAREADSELDNPDPMAFCKKCVELLDLPPDAANPLVARSLSSHRKTLSSGRLDPILDSLLKDADNV